MLELNQSLLACGYTGACENLSILTWAMRAGACSYFFNDLLQWLECRLSLIKSTENVRDSIARLFSMLRQSILMKASYGSDSAINPKEFRLRTLKVLIRQLELRTLPEHKKYLDLGTTWRSAKDFKHLRVTFNMSKNQRLVHCSADC